VKTLHNQNNMFEGSVINTANPANFELRTNLLIEDASKILFDRLTDTNSFDLYISTESDVFYLEKCVITNGTINIERLRPLSLSISGQASKLIPGSSVPSGMTLRTASSSRTYNLNKDLLISLNSTSILDHLVSVSIELQNDIQWIPYKTVQTAAGTRYPTQYTVNGKVLSGNIKRYLNDDTESNSQSYGINQSLRIKAGTTIGGLFKGIDFNSNNCSLTQRVEVGAVFTKSTDWRMVQNPASVSGVLTYFT
jgi:hypothetical protein